MARPLDAGFEERLRRKEERVRTKIKIKSGKKFWLGTGLKQIKIYRTRHIHHYLLDLMAPALGVTFGTTPEIISLLCFLFPRERERDSWARPEHAALSYRHEGPAQNNFVWTHDLG